MSYNGWSNYETWLANLWLDNDEGSQECCRDIVTANRHSPMAAGEALKDWIEEVYAEQIPTTGMIADLVNAALSAVDWREIGENWIENLDPEEEEEEEEEEESAAK